MSGRAEQAYSGPVESKPPEYVGRTAMWPMELEGAIAKFAADNGTTPTALMWELARKHLEANGVEFSSDLDRLMNPPVLDRSTEMPSFNFYQ